jgi:hypothetical protein
VSKKRIRTNREPSSRFQGEGLRKEWFKRRIGPFKDKPEAIMFLLRTCFRSLRSHIAFLWFGRKNEGNKFRRNADNFFNNFTKLRQPAESTLNMNLSEFSRFTYRFISLNINRNLVQSVQSCVSYFLLAFRN